MSIDSSDIDRRARNAVSLRLVFGAFALLIALIVAAFTWDRIPNVEGVATYLGLWLALVACCLFFARHFSLSVRSGWGVDVLEVPIYLSLTSLGLIGIFALAPYFEPGRLLVQLHSLDDLPAGLLLTGVGLISLWLGYGLVSRAWRAASPQGPTSALSAFDFGRPHFGRALVIYSSLVALRLALVGSGAGESFGATNQLGDWQQWLTYALELRWVLLPLYLLQAARGQWPRWTAVVVVAIEVGMAVLTGWASSLLKIAALYFGCTRYYRYRISNRALVAAGLVLVFMTPVARYTRASDSRALPSAVTFAFSGAEESWADWGEGSWRYSWDLLVQRQSAVAQTPAVIMRMTPSQVPYRPVDEILLIPASIVPRVLWPSKPAYGEIGAYVTTAYFGLDTQFGASASTIAGNAYMYGGWLPVILGMFGVGVVCAGFYILVALPALLRDQVGMLAVYAGVVIGNFHIGEGDIVGLWQGLLQRFVVFAVAVAFICLRNRVHLRPASGE